MSKKKVLEKKSFADLINFRKKKDIIINDEIIASLLEPTNEDFSDIISIIINSSKETKEENKTLNETLIPILIRKMWKSEVYVIEELTDDEIVKALATFGSEISEQIESGLQELAMEKVNEKINKLIEISKELQEQMEKESKEQTEGE